jgi:hypothetical protein
MPEPFFLRSWIKGPLFAWSESLSSGLVSSSRHLFFIAQGGFVMLKYWNLLLMGILLTVLTGCGSTYKPFTPMDPAHVIKPARLAVICGGKSELDKNLAQALTEELQTRTSFTVLTQEEIGKKIDKYPVSFQLTESADKKKPVWFSPEEKKKLDAAQAKLKADYLFVVWGTNLTFYSDQNVSKYYMTVLGNMLEYPGGQVVSLTEFYPARKVRLWEILKKDSFFVEDMIKNSARCITDEFLVVTKAGKVLKAEKSK